MPDHAADNPFADKLWYPCRRINPAGTFLRTGGAYGLTNFPDRFDLDTPPNPLKAPTVKTALDCLARRMVFGKHRL